MLRQHSTLREARLCASSGSTKMVDLDSSLLNKEIEVKVGGKRPNLRLRKIQQSMTSQVN